MSTRLAARPPTPSLSSAELVVDLRGPPAAGDLRAALSRALDDPSLDLLFWLPEREAFVAASRRSAA